jgi:hypothetical protein
MKTVTILIVFYINLKCDNIYLARDVKIRILFSLFPASFPLPRAETLLQVAQPLRKREPILSKDS